MLCPTPATHQSDSASNPSHLHFCLVASLLTCALDVVNWIEVMAVWRSHIRHDECMAVGFIQVLHMVALQTLHTKIAQYDNHCRGLAETCLDGVAGLLG